jgi:hypothetical protein
VGIRADQHPNVGASRCPRAGNCRRRTGGVSVGAQRRTLPAAAAAARCHIPPLLLRRTAAPAVRLLEVQCYACEQARRSLRVPPLLRLANQRCGALGACVEVHRLADRRVAGSSLASALRRRVVVHLGSDATTRAHACSVARTTATRARPTCADRATGKRFSECRSAWLSGSLGPARSDAAGIAQEQQRRRDCWIAPRPATSPERCDGSLSGDAAILPAERRSAFPHRACSHEHRG